MEEAFSEEEEEEEEEEVQEGVAAVSTAEAGDGEEEVIAPATEADRAFIDDGDVDPEDRYGSDDGGEPEGDEAEEVEDEDEMEAALKARGKKGRKGKDEKSAAENRAIVDSFLVQMELAATSDIEAFQNKRPAVGKIKFLQRLQVCSKID